VHFGVDNYTSLRLRFITNG